jgi:hypothetical protein
MPPSAATVSARAMTRCAGTGNLPNAFLAALIHAISRVCLLIYHC